MCGVSAIYKYHQDEVQKADLAIMASSIAHRGPDEAGYAILNNGKLGLAHVRLSIVDLAHGQQPMFSADQQVAISYNGEIYDARLHRKNLRALGYQFNTDSDTEVIIALYQEYGIDALEKLNGEFAFVLWDSYRKRLIAARDRCGIKPLFYFHNHQEVIFASEAKSILALDRIQTDFDPKYFLSTPFAFQIQGISAFRDVAAVKPGHFLIIEEDSRIQEHCYWEPKYKPNINVNFEDAKEELRQLLDNAVQRRLVADVPIGTYLSGGIDSTLICGLMSRHHTDFKAFNLSYYNTEYDESDLAKKISNHYGVELLTLPCSMDDLANNVEDSIEHSELLIANPGHVGKNLLSKFARDNGTKVCLTGEGSDELFAGYAFFKQEALWRMLTSQGEEAEQAKDLYKKFEEQEYRSENLNWTKSTQWQMEQSLCGFSSYKQTVVSQLSKMVAPNLYSPDFVDYSKAPTPMQLLHSNYANKNLHQLSPINATRLISMSTLSDYIIPVLGDRAEMANSLECRTPFLDNDVIEFATKLPEEFMLKMDSLREKHILHEAFKKDLPPFIYQQTKHPFSAGDWQSLVTNSRYGRELFDYYLQPEKIKNAGIFNEKYVASLRHMWRSLPVTSPMLKKIQSTMGTILGTQIMHAKFIENRIKPKSTINMIDRTPPHIGQAIAKPKQASVNWY